MSRITDKIVEEMSEWMNRPLDRVYPVVFIDAIRVKVRDGSVCDKAFYVAVGVSVAGERDRTRHLSASESGIWAGGSGDGEGAKYWLAVLTEIKNRGVADVLIVVCDGLKGLPESINTVWKHATVQTCVIHLLRNTFRYTARQDWDRISKDIRSAYEAVNADQAADRFDEFEQKWGLSIPPW